MPGASTSLTFDIFARDRASETFRRLGEQASGASDNVKHLSDRLDKIGQRAVNARIGLKGDKEANAEIDKITARLTVLNRKIANPDVTLEGAAKMRAEISSLELALDKLGSKTARPSVALSKLSFFQPSILGAAVAMLPTLIPLAAEASAAVGAIGISFGAAGLAAAGFGAMAATVLSGASQDLAKLQALQLRLNTANTKAQKKAVEQQIHDLKAGWAKGYLDLIDNYQKFQQKWKSISQAITVPTLNVWLPVLTKGLQFLKPLIKPIADAFTLWGITLNTYFSDPVHAQRIKDMAAAFGNFSAQQLFRIGQFIADIAKGIFNLGKDLAASGANFNAAGTWLSNLGAGFLTWSKSKKARDDVHGFMKFIHDEGPVVKGILKDLGKILPGIFAGATTVGTLELQALGDFLNLVANLPKGWQKPLTEFAGAMLLLSKIGVVKVGLKLTGLEGALAIPGLAGAGTAGGPLALGGAAIAAGLVLRIREDLQKGIKGIISDMPQWFSGVGGILGLAAQGWADAIIKKFGAPLDKFAGPVREKITNWFKGAGSWLVASGKATIDGLWKGIKADWDPFWAWFKNIPHKIISWFKSTFGIGSPSTVFAKFGHDIIQGLWNGITARWAGIVTWMGGLRGRVNGWFRGALSWLAAAGRNVIQGLWNGLISVWTKLRGWVSGIAGWIKAHKGPVALDAKLLFPAGKALMGGLYDGLIHGWSKVWKLVGGVATKITSLLGGGSGALGGDAAANERLARRMFPWGAGQWPAFRSLEMREAGFNRFARNPSSGAYGIPQALPPSKMPFAAQAAGGSHAGPQLSWMFSYIAGRYGTPANAWAHETSFGWYDKGGWLPPGLSLALNTTGRPEQVISSGGAAQPVILEVRSGGGRLDDLLVEIIRNAVKIRGGGNVQVALGKRH